MNQVKDNLENLVAKNTKVLLIYYEDREHARQWIEQQNSPFDMLLDEKRSVYHFFGLGRDANHALGSLQVQECFIRDMARTGKYDTLFENLTNLDVPPGIDFFQKAGNFLLDRQGKLRWLYKAPGATIRPSMEDILEQVTKLQ